MKNKVWKDRETPLSIYFSYLTKQYQGAMVNSLAHLDLDRYFIVLAIIDQHGETFTQQQLADYFNIDKASVVRIVNYLAEKDFIKRQINEHDRREHFLILTDKGKQIVPEIKATMLQLNQAAFSGLNLAQIDQFFFALDSICYNLAQLPTDKLILRLSKVNDSEGIE